MSPVTQYTNVEHLLNTRLQISSIFSGHPRGKNSSRLRGFPVVYTQCHTTHLATGVSRQPVLDCGTIFHPDCGGWDFPSIPLDDL